MTGSRLGPRAARLSATVGIAWLGVEVAAFFSFQPLPTGSDGVVMFGLLILVVFLASELGLQDASQTGDEKEASPKDMFSQSILRYARALASERPPRDGTLLDLRGWSSRLLHLLGRHEDRVELGRLALGAAASMGDTVAESSILIDELGWSLFETGDLEAALQNIREGRARVQQEMQRYPTDELLLELYCKASRHLANLDFVDDKDLDHSRRMLGAIRPIAEQLSFPRRELHQAQLDHSEAELVRSYLGEALGSTGLSDMTGQSGTLLLEATGLAERAERQFASLGDAEREAKALHTKVLLLEHDPRQAVRDAAKARLSRLTGQVARELRAR